MIYRLLRAEIGREGEVGCAVKFLLQHLLVSFRNGLATQFPAAPNDLKPNFKHVGKQWDFVKELRYWYS